MIEIPLTQGKVAVIDDEDYCLVSKYKWYAHMDADATRETWYAWHEVRHGLIIRMHRIIVNAASVELVDHMDLDGLNNRRYNLRKCSKSQNMANRGKPALGSSTYKGVYWSKRDSCWRAQVTCEYSHYSLGRFSTEREAAIAYNHKALEVFGEFARLNEVLS